MFWCFKVISLSEEKISTDNGSNSAAANEDLCVTGIIEGRGAIITATSFEIVSGGAGYSVHQS